MASKRKAPAKRKSRGGHTSIRKSDGKPRKLRKANHPRALRRQARRIKEQSLGRKLKTNERVHHKTSLKDNRPGKLSVENAHNHAIIHPGKGHGGRRPLKRKKRTTKKK